MDGRKALISASPAQYKGGDGLAGGDVFVKAESLR